MRGIRYFLGDLAFAVRGFFGRILRPVGRGWTSLSIHARRRLVALAVVAAAAVAFFALAVPNLPCEFPGGDTCPPADDAAEVVPADSMAYLHINVDPDTDQFRAATEIAGEVPLFTEQIVDRALAALPGQVSSSADFSREIAPWLGGEIAIAQLPGGRPSGETAVALEVDDSGAATDYAAGLATGRTTTESYRGFDVTVDERGLATAQAGGFLLIGSRDGVRAMIETASGATDAPPIASDPTADEIRDQLPDDRFADVYVSPAGAAEAVSRRSAGIPALAPFISPGTTRGAAAALSASSDTLQLSIRSALDPEREKASPSFFAAFPRFAPELPQRLSADALAYLGIGAPGTTVKAVLTQAAADAPGIAKGFKHLVKQVKKGGGVNVESDLLTSLGDEAAIAVEPGGGSPATLTGGIPYLQFIARGVDEDKARAALAALEGPLADAISAGGESQAPVFGSSEVDGVQVHSLRLSPAINLAYAIFDGLAVIATDPAGVGQVASGDGGLDESKAYEQATDGFDDQSSLIAFLDLRDLLTEGFSIGLGQVPAFNTFAGDFRHLEALGLQVEASDDSISTDARLVLGAPPAPEESAPPAPGSD
jgi:Protein of unknown function (DUF3352)